MEWDFDGWGGKESEMAVGAMYWYKLGRGGGLVGYRSRKYGL